MQTLLFLVNPHAGKGEMRRAGMDCIDIFVRAGFQVTVITTQSAQQATEIMVAQGANYDRIVCSGGDGTFNEVVTGYLRAGLHCPLGYIPSGTVNDFATSLQLPRIPIIAADTAAYGQVQDVDIGRFHDRYFTYVAAFGAFTDVSYTTSQDIKNVIGRMAYILKGIQSVPQLKNYEMTVQTDDHVVSGRFLFGMISNATTVAGMRGPGAQDVAMDDGLFEVTLVRLPTSPADWQRALFELSNPEQDWTYVYRTKASRVSVSGTAPVPWTLDGEFGGNLEQVDIENLPRQIPILVQGESV